MNKVLSAFIQEYNLAYDGKEKAFYGTMSGMQVSGGVSIWTAQNVLSFHVHLPEDRLGETNQFLCGIQKTYGIQNFNLAGDGIVCVLLASPKKYVACAEAIAGYLTGIGVKGGCPFCENDLTEGARLVGSASGIYRAHERCFDEYVEKVKGEEEAYKAAPNENLLKAVGGMLLGMIAGCLIWVVLFVIGYLAMIAPVLGAFLGAFLWDKFGGKNDKLKIIVIWVASLLLFSLTLFLCYYVDALNAVNQYGYNMSPIEYFIDNLNTNEKFRSGVIIDVAMSYVFIFAANIYVTLQVAKTQKLMSKTFRKL